MLSISRYIQVYQPRVELKKIEIPPPAIENVQIKQEWQDEQFDLAIPSNCDIKIEENVTIKSEWQYGNIEIEVKAENDLVPKSEEWPDEEMEMVHKVISNLPLDFDNTTENE